MSLKTFILKTDKDVTEENLHFFLDFIRDNWDLPLEKNNVLRGAGENANQYTWTIDIPELSDFDTGEFAKITATERIVTWLAFLRKNASPCTYLSYQKENSTICFDIQKKLIDWVFTHLEEAQEERFNILLADVNYITSINEHLSSNDNTKAVKRPLSPPLSLHFARMDVLPPTNNEKTPEKATNNHKTSQCTIM